MLHPLPSALLSPRGVTCPAGRVELPTLLCPPGSGRRCSGLVGTPAAWAGNHCPLCLPDVGELLAQGCFQVQLDMAKAPGPRQHRVPVLPNRAERGQQRRSRAPATLCVPIGGSQRAEPRGNVKSCAQLPAEADIGSPQLPGPKMGPSWAVLLLCSLLSPSRGFRLLPSAPRAAAAGVEQAVFQQDLPQPRAGLLGGNLLGGLLGKDGPVGGLLGKDGPVGGLLGKDGPVGGLLGKGGLLGGLLGGNGVLGGLLGADGAVGSLLGGLLDSEGVLGGVLGKGGVLDGVLGKDGLLDALLGKDGLVDSLLDAVLNLLIGKGGILARDGLVGSLLGGNGGDPAGPKIVNNSLPRISLRSLPGFGHQLGFNTQLLVETTSATGKELCLQVEADADLLVQDKWAAPQSARDCQAVDISIRFRPKVPLLEQPLQRLLADALREKGCNILNARLGVLSSLLRPGSPALPLGALGDLPPFSITSGDSVQMDLDLPPPTQTSDWVTVRDPGTGSAEGSPLRATLLLATGRPPRLSLPQQALGALLEQSQEHGDFDLNITNHLGNADAHLQGQVPNSLSLSTAALFPFIPQLSRVLPGSLPLELHLRVAKKPEVAVRGRGATATLGASIAVVVPALQKGQRPLFSLDADITLSIVPSVQDGRLRISLALDSISLTRAPPRLDPASASSLAEWLKQVLASAYVPGIDDALSVSVPLPSFLSTNLRNVQVDITDAEPSSWQSSLAGSCPSGTPSRLLA
ncbi:BPI fold-containing family B member 3-like [Pogoniulus pusillus]|uniref:BPI fold-containing family B member 3-like n=1 Tax=Pogoniulus pusillus TaxID=488313 RepID=UPI0030B92432